MARDVAQAFALKEWIKCVRNSRVASYEITAAGRAALKSYLAEDMLRKRRARGEQDGSNAFARAHERNPNHVFIDDEGGLIGPRPSVAESPLAMLARRRDRDGKLFLERDLVHAGERFREDFELSQIALRTAQSVERMLDPNERAPLDDTLDEGVQAARARLTSALDDLGPGLGDIILRCCCLLEGLEAAERRMGWSARSGKVVLRIALQRLRCHYIEKHGHVSAMIG